ncbi:MAG: Crp/Fnr family transcriptional regulator [Eubacteriales bacterium]|nr:Crp/Fnr family transcriptional regulator [Eubacteriales bacterium]
MELSLLRKCRLFKGFSDREIVHALGCLGARERRYHKGEYLLISGSPAGETGLVLSGSALVIREDYWGNRSILSIVGPGELLAEAFAGGEDEPLAVSVQAAEDIEVLLLSTGGLLGSRSDRCQLKARLTRTMLDILLAENRKLLFKIEDSTQRSTREKLMSYLSRQALSAGSEHFTIPYNRQALADYLGVDRSALSREMARMADEGLIAYDRNDFRLRKIGKA